MTGGVWSTIKTVVVGIETRMNFWTPTLQCDYCQTQYRAHGLAPFGSLYDPTKVEAVIRANGWDIVGGKHICPDCACDCPQCMAER